MQPWMGCLLPGRLRPKNIDGGWTEHGGTSGVSVDAKDQLHVDRSSCTCCTACKGPCPPCTDYSAFSKLSITYAQKAPHFKGLRSFQNAKKEKTGKEGRKTSLFALGTLMAIPRFSNWLVPSGTRPPGTKVLTGRELPSLAVHKALIRMKVLGENLPPGWTRHWHCRLRKDAKLAEAKFPNCCKASAHCQQIAWEPGQRFSLGPLQPLHRHPPQNISRARINIWRI